MSDGPTVIDKIVDNDDPVRVRKSLLTVALFTIFFANIQFSANELSLLGLKLIVNPERLVALGRVSTALIFLIFLLRSLPKIVSTIQSLQERRLLSLRNAESADLTQTWGGNEPPYFDEGPNGEFEAHTYKFDYLEKSLQEKFTALNFWVALTSALLIDYALPVSAGIVATVSPYSVSDLISYLASTPTTTSVYN